MVRENCSTPTKRKREQVFAMIGTRLRVWRRNDKEADRHVGGLHSLAGDVLLGEVLDLLVQHSRVFHEVHHNVDGVVDAHQMGAVLRAIWFITLDAAEQSSRLRVTLEHSKPQIIYARINHVELDIKTVPSNGDSDVISSFLSIPAFLAAMM